jgi:hypothetical protein
MPILHDRENQVSRGKVVSISENGEVITMVQDGDTASYDRQSLALRENQNPEIYFEGGSCIGRASVIGAPEHRYKITKRYQPGGGYQNMTPSIEPYYAYRTIYDAFEPADAHAFSVWHPDMGCTDFDTSDGIPYSPGNLVYIYFSSERDEIPWNSGGFSIRY